MRKYILLVLIICLSLSIMTLSGCSGGGTLPSEDGKLNIVCAGFVAYDLCREVLGGEEGLTLLGRAGMDMHSFEPTAADVVALSNADVFVYVGGESSGWADGMIAAAKNAQLITVKMTDYGQELCSHDHDHGEEVNRSDDHGADEHVWLSLGNAERIVEAIRLATERAAVANGIDSKAIDAYNKNAKEYAALLGKLQSDYKEMVESAERRVILVADRFPFVHLACELGLEYYAAFPGCSTETNASFATQAKLIEAVREHGLPCIFKIDGSDGTVAQKVSAETGAKVLILDSAQVVSADRMASGESYLNIMKKNFEALSEALN
ncbi:MAG: zinc ABC transporter substrate-binding protein [Ruminococcaceae bacterium]|nr:zinc ABC transporter substrate-binding protein [Oscillospiraceae bacterium]